MAEGGGANGTNGTDAAIAAMVQLALALEPPVQPDENDSRLTSDPIKTQDYANKLRTLLNWLLEWQRNHSGVMPLEAGLERAKGALRRVPGRARVAAPPEEAVAAYETWLPGNEAVLRAMVETYKMSSKATYMNPVALAARWLSRRTPDQVLKASLFDWYKRWMNEAFHIRRIVEIELGDREWDSTLPTMQDLRWALAALRARVATGGQDPMRLHFEQLVLALYVETYPLRNNWGTVRVYQKAGGRQRLNADERLVSKDDGSVAVVDGRGREFDLPRTQNRLVVRHDGTMAVVINTDKVSKHRDFRANRVIEILPEAAATLSASLAAYPRTWVLPKVHRETVDLEQPMKSTGVSNMLDRTTGVKALIKRRGKTWEKPIDTLRAARASDEYTRPTATYRHMRTVALSMRHSLATALRVYRRPARTDASSSRPVPSDGQAPDVDADRARQCTPASWDRAAWRKRYAMRRRLAMQAALPSPPAGPSARAPARPSARAPARPRR